MNRRELLLGVLVLGACEPRRRTYQYPPQPPPQPPPPPIASAPAPPAPAPSATAAPPSVAGGPIPAERFEPAKRFVESTKLDLYGYHMNRIGNAEGYLAPMVLTSDGGFVVVGTRADYPPGKYQVGKSRPVVAKLDASGAQVWEKAYRTTGFLDYEGASAIEVDGGYVVYVLSYVHPARGAVVRLLRVDRSGGVVWDTRFRGQGRENTPFAQTVRLHQGVLVLEGHIYKDSSETAWGWKATVSLDGKVLSDEIGAANPYGKH